MGLNSLAWNVNKADGLNGLSFSPMAECYMFFLRNKILFWKCREGGWRGKSRVVSWRVEASLLKNHSDWESRVGGKGHGWKQARCHTEMRCENLKWRSCTEGVRRNEKSQGRGRSKFSQTWWPAGNGAWRRRTESWMNSQASDWVTG